MSFLCDVDLTLASSVTKLENLFIDSGVSEPLNSAVNLVSSATQGTYENTYKTWVGYVKDIKSFVYYYINLKL